MLLEQPAHGWTLGTSQALGTCEGSEPTGVYLPGRKHGLENSGINKLEIEALFWWSWWTIHSSVAKRKSNMAFGLGFGQHHNENLANSSVQTHHSSYPNVVWDEEMQSHISRYQEGFWQAGWKDGGMILGTHFWCLTQISAHLSILKIVTEKMLLTLELEAAHYS